MFGRVEDVFTHDQIELKFHFAQRERAREVRIDEATTARGVAWGMTGEKPT